MTEEHEPERLPTCKQIVELVTDYFEGSLPADECEKLEQHLVWCNACRNYLEQMRETARITGRISEESLSDEARDELVQLFRDWRR